MSLAASASVATTPTAPERPKLNKIHEGDFSAKPEAAPVLVSEAQWMAERQKLLALEKDLMRLQDAVTLQRRQMPWHPVDHTKKEFALTDLDGGAVTLKDLFKGEENKALVVQHMMWDTWGPCSMCAAWIDQLGAVAPQLSSRAIYVVAVSGADATLEKLRAHAALKGWADKVRVVKATHEFGHALGVSRSEEEATAGTEASKAFVYNFSAGGDTSFGGCKELPGITVFAVAPDGTVCRTYAAQSRGLEGLMSMFQLLDATPRGRCGFFPRAREEIDDYAVTGPRKPEPPK